MTKNTIYIQTEDELFVFKAKKSLLREMENEFNGKNKVYPSKKNIRNLRSIIVKKFI